MRTRRCISSRAERVVTFIPGSARLVHEATGFREPSTSTMHRRQPPKGSSLGS